MLKKTFVLSVGGSLINPGQINADFLKQFRSLIVKYAQKGHKFIIITGGGAPARQYQAALKKIIKTNNGGLDWMGIFTTRLNAALFQLMFGKLAHPNIVLDPNNQARFNEKILLAGGWKPGRSTDDCAVRLAKTYGSTTIINLSNIDYVYNKDPKKFKDAKKLEKISWRDFLGIVGKSWDPGANLPFDPTAAGNAKKWGMKVVITNGLNLKNLENILLDKPFLGTVVG